MNIEDCIVKSKEQLCVVLLKDIFEEGGDD